MSERFTSILHEIAVQLTKTEDDALTIRYPQLPRVGDVVNLKREGEEVNGKVSSRALVGKSGFRLDLLPTDWVVAAEEVAAEGLGDDLAAPVETAV